MAARQVLLAVQEKICLASFTIKPLALVAAMLESPLWLVQLCGHSSPTIRHPNHRTNSQANMSSSQCVTRHIIIWLVPKLTRPRRNSSATKKTGKSSPGTPESTYVSFEFVRIVYVKTTGYLFCSDLPQEFQDKISFWHVVYVRFLHLTVMD